LLLSEIHEKVNSYKIKWRGHATQRLNQRRITRSNAIHALLNGDIIEDYPEDFPFPSCLVLDSDENDLPLHIVCSIGQDFLWIITVYRPDSNRWENDNKTRKR